MDELKYRKSNLSMSFLLMKLYGQKSYSEVKDYQDILLVKKYYLKLIKSFKHAILETLEIADKNQIQSLLNILKNRESILLVCKTFSDIDQVFISMQTELIFQLLGQIPNRSQTKNVLNRKENWKLNGLRQIQYVQNIRHKEVLIFKIIQEKYMDRFGDWSDFVMLYWKECNDNPEKLIEYLKIKHPDIYQEIA
jgi:hypothetical protein